MREPTSKPVKTNSVDGSKLSWRDHKYHRFYEIVNQLLDGDRLSVTIRDDISLELTFKDGYFDHSNLDFVEGVEDPVRVGVVKCT